MADFKNIFSERIRRNSRSSSACPVCPKGPAGSPGPRGPPGSTGKGHLSLRVVVWGLRYMYVKAYH